MEYGDFDVYNCILFFSTSETELKGVELQKNIKAIKD